MKCFLCPNRCGVDRGIVDGICHADEDMRICRIAPHFGEEPIVSGTNGSGTVFFSGCSLDCSFCQNYQISKNKVGKVYSPQELADELKKLVDLGVHNVNFVTPTHFSRRIRETLDLYRPPVPIVYNTSGYELPEVIEEMNDYVDVYLTDVKYADPVVAEKYSRRKNYVEYCVASTDKMIEAKPLRYGEDGLLKQGVIVRHLVLPTEIKNTLDVIDLFAERWKDRALFSLMSQFFPAYHSPIDRTLKPIEYKAAIARLEQRGVENGFVQELSSAQEKYVPPFDLSD